MEVMASVWKTTEKAELLVSATQDLDVRINPRRGGGHSLYIVRINTGGGALPIYCNN